MINPAIFIKEPLIFSDNLKIYPPSVKEVVTNSNFNMFYKILTMTQEDIHEELLDRLAPGEKEPSPFEYLMLSSQYLKGFSILVKEAFKLFCKTDIEFLFNINTIAIKGIQNKSEEENDLYDRFCLTQENYFEFQNAIRQSIGDKELEKPIPDDPNEDPRITEIKRRAKARDRLKAKHANKNGISLDTCLVSICCMGIGITPLNIGEMSYASVGVIMKMMQEKEKYDIDIRSLLAGADSKKVKPKYWIRNEDKD